MNLNCFSRSCLISTILLFMSLSSTLAQTKPEPFFLMGDGKLHIQNLKTQQEADVKLILSNGSYDESALKRIDAVFGFPAKERGSYFFETDLYAGLFLRPGCPGKR